MLISANLSGTKMIDRTIPVTRVAFILHYAALAESLGAPVERLLAESGISEELLDYPAAAVCLKSAYKFGELACEATGTEHLGLYVGMQSCLRDLGPVGRNLRRSTTVYDYLRKGIALYDTLITGQRIWLSGDNEDLHLNVATTGEPGPGPYQSQLETLTMTTMVLRRALGMDWSPGRVCLTYRSGEAFPAESCFAGSHIVKGAESSYIAIPRTAMGKPFTSTNLHSGQVPESIETQHLSEDISDIVHLQIEAMLCERKLHIDKVAESLSMTRRSLQRALAEQGTSYSCELADVQSHEAIKRLQKTDQPIAEIAYDLGYNDASNFTRAFRHMNGVSPQQFRKDLNLH